MESRSHALLAGVFVLVFIAGVAAVLFWFTGKPTDVIRYRIVSRIAVSGLMVEAPVRLRGVDVGSVESIRFDDEDPRNIIVTITVDENAPMTRGVYAQLALWGISGLRYVALSDDGTNPEPLPPGGRIEMRASFIGQAETSVGTLLASAESVLERVEALLSEENVTRAGRTIALLEQAADSAEETIGLLRSDVARGTWSKVDTLVELLIEDARKFDQLLTRLNDEPQSLILGRTPSKPGPGERGFDDRKDRR